MERFFFASSGVAGFLTVAFGAFGAHALRSKLEPLADGAKRWEWWHTATLYAGLHALALALAAYLVGRTGSTAATVAGFGFLAGIVLFSGSLYTMTLSGIRALGAITPFGGLAFLVGWAAIVATSIKPLRALGKLPIQRVPLFSRRSASGLDTHRLYRRFCSRCQSRPSR